MDREIAELERRLALEDERPNELVLELARAYARSGRREDAWVLYAEVSDSDPELDALGQALGEAEVALVAQLPDWATVYRRGEGTPAEIVVLEPPEAIGEGFSLPALPFVTGVTLDGSSVTGPFAAALNVLPRLEKVELEAGYEWRWNEDGDGECPQLYPFALKQLAALPLKTLDIDGYACAPDALGVFSMCTTLEEVELSELRGLDAQSLDWISKLPALKTLDLRQVPTHPELWGALPPLEKLCLREVDADEEPMRELLRRSPLKDLELKDVLGVVGAEWLDDVPSSLTELTVDERTPLAAVGRCVARLPELRLLGVSVSTDSDVAWLNDLQSLTSLWVDGPWGDACLAQIPELLGRLEVFYAQGASFGPAGVALLQERFKGDLLGAGMRAIPCNVLRRFKDAPIQRMTLTVRPLTREASERLTTELSAGRENVFIMRHARSPDEDAGFLATGDVLQLAQLGLELPELTLDTRWADVPQPERMLQVLRDAYDIDDSDLFGGTVRETAKRVEARWNGY